MFLNCSRRCDGKFRIEEVDGRNGRDEDEGGLILEPASYVAANFMRNQPLMTMV